MRFYSQRKYSRAHIIINYFSRYANFVPQLKIQSMGRRSGKTCTCCLGILSSCSAVTGVILVAAGITLMSVFPSILEQQVEEVELYNY